jgi:hypothetical protein
MGDPAEEMEIADPWPVWCERLALLLGIAVTCLIVGAALTGIAVPGFTFTNGAGRSVHPSVVERLRVASLPISAFDGFLLLAAAILLALDGITSGERRRLTRPMGAVAAYLGATLAAIIVVVSGARCVDMLLGHVEAQTVPIQYTFAGRLTAALPQAASALVAAAACWLAFSCLDNDDAWWRSRPAPAEDDDDSEYFSADPGA